jgi:hypothetical protein
MVQGTLWSERNCWLELAQMVPDSEHEDKDNEQNDIAITLFHDKLLCNKDSLHIIPYGQFTI